MSAPADSRPPARPVVMRLPAREFEYRRPRLYGGVRIGQVMDQLAVPAHDDLLAQFTRDVPVPRPRRHRFARMFRSHPRPA